MEQKTYAYPYIPKQYYPAVMLACKILREDGTYNRALSIAANYYDVDEDILKKHVDARVHAKKRESGYKMKWFVIERRCHCDANYDYGADVFVAKGRSKETVESGYAKFDWEEQRRNDYGGSYAPYWTTSVISEHDTKEEAQLAANRLKGGAGCTTY